MSLPAQLFARAWGLPKPRQPASLASPPGPGLPRGQTLRVMTWNVQFCAGRRQHFFYDGGHAVYVPEADQHEALDGIAAVIEAAQPDLLLLQELDRDSARTGRTDQLAALQARLTQPYAHVAAAPYFQVPYVPYPPQRPLGRMHMDLVTLSRFPLAHAERIALPLLHEPAWRRLFNLRRAILHATLPLEGGGQLHVLNTHLSAFSRGDGTLRRQVEALLAHSQATTGPLVLAGDLNLLPPGDDPARLGADAALYADQPNPAESLYAQLSPVLTPAALAEGALGTWMPYGSLQADRTIDHAFTRQARSAGPQIWPAQHSDHLPLVFELTVD